LEWTVSKVERPSLSRGIPATQPSVSVGEQTSTTTTPSLPVTPGTPEFEALHYQGYGGEMTPTPQETAKVDAELGKQG
jgi:hypothetical protein